MTSGLEELAERVENLTGPCRETDAQIKIAFAAQLFAGGATKDDAVKILGGDLYAEPLPYTASLEAVMTLVPENCTFALGDCNQDDVPWACVTDDAGEDYAATGATPTLALLSASLHARSAANG